MSEHQEHDGLRLLSLDGGGIRGLSELLILRQIMERIQFQESLKEQPLPCDYFDLIGGTSTGGIIALMLGRLRMSVTRAIECYGTLAEKVFSDVKQPGGDGKFKASKLEEVIKAIVKEKTEQTDARMMDTRPDGERCKTFVCAMGALNMAAGIPRLFRTYHAPKNQTFDCTIWEAARATSAAPTFFKRIVIGGPGSSEPYIDGGMGRNNPIAQVLEEAELVFPGRHVACIVSIGTGQAQTISIPKPGLFQRVLPLDVLKAIRGIATDCERSAQEIARRFQSTPNVYFRFNVEQGLQNVGLAQWERLDEVTAHTEQYIRMAEVDQKLGAVVAAVCGRQNVIATAHMSGTVRPSTRQQASPKCCPPPTPVFTGRQDILTQMEEYFSNDLGKRHVFVLHGLGGAGKSQIAFKFVEHCQVETEPSRFSDVFFVDASTAETISADLESIALAKGVGESMDDALGWLARQREEWLLLLDNADDTTLNLRRYFPPCSHGNILVTSRNRDTLRHASGARSNCQISGMNSDDAINLLLQVAGLQEGHTTETEALATIIVKELGHLALAVVQAGAYISSSECGLRRYLDMYRERRGELLEEYRNSVQKIDNYKWTAYTTWTISFDRLSKQAATFLQLCAFLHHDGISEGIFQNSAVNITTYAPVVPVTGQESDSLSKAKDFLGWFRTLEAPWDIQKFLKIIVEIRSYSLINFDATNQTYSIHPLVHAWTRTTISNSEVTRTSVLYILGIAVPYGSTAEEHASRRTLLPHIDMALQGGATIGPEVSARFGNVYLDGGRWKEAEEFWAKVRQMSVRTLGADHPDTLVAMTNLAVTYLRQGRWAEAEELLLHVKETRKRVLGAEHPATLSSMMHLATTLWDQGRRQEAEKLQVQVKEMRERVLGTDHPDTLTSMQHLALTFLDRGRWKEAEALQVQVRETRERVLGAEHPHTLASVSNLALMFSRRGRTMEAEKLQVQVKKMSESMFGMEHPDTLTSMSNLAATFCIQERWKEAEELQVHVKETSERKLGAEHPDTLMHKSNLAATYLNQGRWKEAVELQIQVKETSERVLGAKHPHTLNSMANLASMFSDQGRWKEAEKLQVQVKHMRERVLGLDHPDTVAAMFALALTFLRQGQLQEAEQMVVPALGICERVLGTEHQDTVAIMVALATTFVQQGRWKEAEDMAVTAMKVCERVIGAERPDTLSIMETIASMFSIQGRWKEAEALQIQVKETRERVLGVEHQDTLMSMANLALTYRAQGKSSEAEELDVQVEETKKKVTEAGRPDTSTSTAIVAPK